MSDGHCASEKPQAARGPTLEEDMLAAQGGDEEAANRVVTRVHPQLYHVALRVMGDHHLAEEAAQQAVVNALVRYKDTYQPGTRVLSWLYRILINCCRRIAARERRSAQPLDGPEPTVTDGPLADLEKQELRSLVWAAIAKLPPRQREVTALVLEGEKYFQIAETLGMTQRAVKKCAFDARQNLRSYLRPMQGV